MWHICHNWPLEKLLCPSTHHHHHLHHLHRHHLHYILHQAREDKHPRSRLSGRGQERSPDVKHISCSSYISSCSPCCFNTMSKSLCCCLLTMRKLLFFMFCQNTPWFQFAVFFYGVSFKRYHVKFWWTFLLLYNVTSLAFHHFISAQTKWQKRPLWVRQ